MNIGAILTAGVLIVGIAAGGFWGESRYKAGYTAAETKAQQENQAALEQLRQAQYRASAAYQAAKAEREAAEQIRKGKIYEITQRDSYQRDCFDADGLRELKADIGRIRKDNTLSEQARAQKLANRREALARLMGEMPE